MSKIQFWLGEKEFNLKLLNQFQLFPMQKFSFPSNFDENWRFFILQLFFSSYSLIKSHLLNFFLSFAISVFISLKIFSSSLETNKTIKKFSSSRFVSIERCNWIHSALIRRRKLFLFTLKIFWSGFDIAFRASFPRKDRSNWFFLVFNKTFFFKLFNRIWFEFSTPVLSIFQQRCPSAGKLFDSFS